VPAAQRFTATLQQGRGEGGRWLKMPFDAREVFGQLRPPVRGTINGTPMRARLSVYGGETYLGLRREIRDAAGIEVGDDVEVVLELDDVPRVVEMPTELTVALAADAGVQAAYDELSFTHRREYAQWVGEAKRKETRDKRATRAVDMLREGIKHP
jgi:bifunctional DNA-binding transcriptional regulator/antitoxin component of YhaV-PrlF toxin-antitoxin module